MDTLFEQDGPPNDPPRGSFKGGQVLLDYKHASTTRRFQWIAGDLHVSYHETPIHSFLSGSLVLPFPAHSSKPIHPTIAHLSSHRRTSSHSMVNCPATCPWIRSLADNWAYRPEASSALDCCHILHTMECDTSLERHHCTTAPFGKNYSCDLRSLYFCCTQPFQRVVSFTSQFSRVFHTICR